jgi:DNA polymerase-3 subunit gamma/tau
MAQALYRRWRPRTFEEVVGQEHVVRTLRNALDHERVHHAYLFTGPRGTGKTTTARLLAKAVNCLATDVTKRPCNECTVCQAVNEGRLMDLIEIDAASNTGVDDVRELRERVGYRPSEARTKVYVVDEVHMLSNAAFNALLKTLEEPPPHVLFILATTDPQKVPATVLSRCQRLDFRRIPLTTIVGRLERIAGTESLTAEREALTLMARQATGSMRDAESLLDQLAAYDANRITVDDVRAALGTGTDEAVTSLVDALAAADVARGLAIVDRAVNEGADPRQFARQMVDHLRTLLLARLGSEEAELDVPDGLRERFQAQTTRFSPRQLAGMVHLFSRAATEARTAWQPQLPLELALVDAALSLEEAASGREPQMPNTSAEPETAPKQAPPTPSNPARQAGPASPPPSHASPEAGTLETVKARWPDLLRTIRAQNLSLEALLRSGEPLKIEEGVLVLGFAHQFHRDKVEEEDCRRAVEEGLTGLLGQATGLRCVVTGLGPGPSSPPPPGQRPPQAEDGLVQAAVERLGARVVDR